MRFTKVHEEVFFITHSEAWVCNVKVCVHVNGPTFVAIFCFTTFTAMRDEGRISIRMNLSEEGTWGMGSEAGDLEFL